MTAPPLPITLSRLAELLPERFPHACPQYVAVRWQGKRVPLFHTSEGEWHRGIHAAYLEGALREECEARGWFIEQWGPIEGNWGADILLPSAPDGIDRLRGTWRDPGAKSPAHALALALLAALDGGGA